MFNLFQHEIQFHFGNVMKHILDRGMIHQHKMFSKINYTLQLK